MGIKLLTKLLNENAANAIREAMPGDLTGRKIAVDASMAIYQFLVAIRSNQGDSAPSSHLTNEAGEVTSHIIGFFYRTIKMVEAGIKPVYVFDGKAPTLKGGELAKRRAAKELAEKSLEEARETGDKDAIERFQKRTVRMGTNEVNDCKVLLRLMGIPVVEAPCEAEAQCAALAKAGKVWAAASEDMDTLTFGSPRLIRKLWDAGKKDKSNNVIPTQEYNLAIALESLDLTMDQFIDVCILAGCDYCPTIKGIAIGNAYKLVKEHGSLKGVLENLDPNKYPLPEGVDFDEVRSLFVNPEVLDPTTIDLKWTDPDQEGLIEFLVKKNGFDEKRVLTGIEKLKKAKGQGSQMHLDNFFSIQPAIKRSTPTKDTKGTKKVKK